MRSFLTAFPPALDGGDGVGSGGTGQRRTGAASWRGRGVVRDLVRFPVHRGTTGDQAEKEE